MSKHPIPLEIESRHSDYGPDAGGYRVLRFNGEMVGRIDDREAAQKLLLYVTKLEQSEKALLEAYEQSNRTCAFDSGCCRLRADDRKL